MFIKKEKTTTGTSLDLNMHRFSCLLFQAKRRSLKSFMIMCILFIDLCHNSIPKDWVSKHRSWFQLLKVRSSPKSPSTIMFLSIHIDCSGQIHVPVVLTHISLLLKGLHGPDQSLHCLLFCLHHSTPYCIVHCSTFKVIMIVLGVQTFQILQYCVVLTCLPTELVHVLSNVVTTNSIPKVYHSV